MRGAIFTLDQMDRTQVDPKTSSGSTNMLARGLPRKKADSDLRTGLGTLALPLRTSKLRFDAEDPTAGLSEANSGGILGRPPPRTPRFLVDPLLSALCGARSQALPSAGHKCEPRMSGALHGQCVCVCVALRRDARLGFTGADGATVACGDRPPPSLAIASA